MRTIISLLGICLLFVSAPALRGAESEDAEASSVEPAHKVVMVGSYTWNKRQKEGWTLRAVFTSDDGENWTATWDSGFNKKNYPYTGTATGDPEGTISGNADPVNGKRTFIFEGTMDNGVMEGKHWETTPKRGKAQKTFSGTFTLKPEASDGDGEAESEAD
ncbi:MAG: hypothetical protein ACOCZK_04835 [Planctomycetota bacterium]